MVSAPEKAQRKNISAKLDNGSHAELEPGFYRDEDGGIFKVSPGRIYYKPIEKPQFDLAAGTSILVPITGVKGNDHKENTQSDYYRFGVVVGCGHYQQRGGIILFDYEEFPLPVGTLIEHATMSGSRRPQRSVWKGEEVEHITSDVLEGWYLPGKWPKWAIDVWDGKKQKLPPMVDKILAAG